MEDRRAAKGRAPMKLIAPPLALEPFKSFTGPTVPARESRDFSRELLFPLSYSLTFRSTFAPSTRVCRTLRSAVFLFSFLLLLFSWTRGDEGRRRSYNLCGIIGLRLAFEFRDRRFKKLRLSRRSVSGASKYLSPFAIEWRLKAIRRKRERERECSVALK